MRQQMKPSWRDHGIISKGGVHPSIVPNVTELLYALRTPTKIELLEVKEKVAACFDAAAMATGCKVEYGFSEKPYWNLITNSKMADVFRKNCAAFGVKFDKKEYASSASIDMGNVSHIVPSIHPLFYIEASSAPHTKEFATAAGDEKAQVLTLNQGKAMALTALDIFADQSLLQQIKEFRISKVKFAKNY